MKKDYRYVILIPKGYEAVELSVPESLKDIFNIMRIKKLKQFSVNGAKFSKVFLDECTSPHPKKEEDNE